MISVLYSLKCSFYETGKLLVMNLGEAHCGSSHNWSSSIFDLVCFLEMLLNVSKSWSCIGISTGILWLFLCPGHRSIWIFLKLRNDLLKWERTEILNSEDSNIILVLFGSVFFEVKVYLTSTKNDFSHLICLKFRVLIRNDILESGAFYKVLEIRCSTLVSQQFLWGHND